MIERMGIVWGALWAVGVIAGCSAGLDGSSDESNSGTGTEQVGSQEFEVTSGSCSPNPCRNGGSCRLAWGGHVCACAPGWTGPNCQTDINECLTGNVCSNGTCTNTLGSYVCSCAPGWSGPTCQNHA